MVATSINNGLKLSRRPISNSDWVFISNPILLLKIVSKHDRAHVAVIDGAFTGCKICSIQYIIPKLGPNERAQRGGPYRGLGIHDHTPLF